MDEKLNPDTEAAPASVPSTTACGKQDNDQFSCIQTLGLAFLTFNVVLAVYRSKDDPSTVAFVLVSYLDLLLLFYCLRRFERTPLTSPTRGKLKIAVWLLSTVLTGMFSYRVAAIMPLPMALIVWAMAGLTIFAGFYAFFIYRDGNGSGSGKSTPEV